MAPTVISNYPILVRKRTGLFSLDVALGNKGDIGAPLRNIYELYGYPNSGKSTLAYFLAGKLSGTLEISVCDLENLDVKYLGKAVGQSGFDGVIQVMDVTDKKGNMNTHEDMLQSMLKYLDTTSGAAILDSVGAIQPMAEQKGDLGEAFMGKRAKLVAQVSRAFSNIVRSNPHDSVAIVINHVHSIIGGNGHTTAGGETLKFMAAVRAMVWTTEVFTKSAEDKEPIGFLITGKIEKLRFGGRGKTFQYYIVPGYGVHVGASAMFDCFNYGLADRDTTVKMDGKSMGYIKKEFLDYAYQGKTRKFDAFEEKLRQFEAETKWEEFSEPEPPVGEMEVPDVPIRNPDIKSKGKKK